MIPIPTWPCNKQSKLNVYSRWKFSLNSIWSCAFIGLLCSCRCRYHLSLFCFLFIVCHPSVGFAVHPCSLSPAQPNLALPSPGRAPPPALQPRPSAPPLPQPPVHPPPSAKKPLCPKLPPQPLAPNGQPQHPHDPPPPPAQSPERSSPRWVSIRLVRMTSKPPSRGGSGSIRHSSLHGCSVCVCRSWLTTSTRVL